MRSGSTGITSKRAFVPAMRAKTRDGASLSIPMAHAERWRRASAPRPPATRSAPAIAEATGESAGTCVGQLGSPAQAGSAQSVRSFWYWSLLTPSTQYPRSDVGQRVEAKSVHTTGNVYGRPLPAPHTASHSSVEYGSAERQADANGLAPQMHASQTTSPAVAALGSVSVTTSSAPSSAPRQARRVVTFLLPSRRPTHIMPAIHHRDGQGKVTRLVHVSPSGTGDDGTPGTDRIQPEHGCSREVTRIPLPG